MMNKNIGDMTESMLKDLIEDAKRKLDVWLKNNR